MGQLGTEIRDWVISIAVAVALAMFIRTFVVELYLVDGPSMMPTLEHQQRLVVNKFIYKMRAPERGGIFSIQTNRRCGACAGSACYPGVRCQDRTY